MARPSAAPSVDDRMMPREHGAWGQLLAPLVTALAMGSLHARSGALALAALAAFVAHEPALIALGHRGGRAKALRGAAAMRAMALRGGAAVGFAVAAHTVGGGMSPAPSLLALAMVALSMPFVLSRNERTTAGEVVLASTLAAAAVPVARAGGVSWEGALVAWGLWSLHGLLATLAVRGMIVRQRRAGSAHLAVAGAALGALCLGGVSVVVSHAPWLCLAAAPCAVLAVAFALRPVAPAHLRRVGWTLVASSALTAVGIGLGAG